MVKEILENGHERAIEMKGTVAKDRHTSECKTNVPDQSKLNIIDVFPLQKWVMFKFQRWLISKH